MVGSSSLRLILPLALLALATVDSRAAAQDEQDLIPPAFVSRLDGSVTLIRNAETSAAVAGAPVVDGDRYLVGSGRLAMQWPDGLVLTADTETALDYQEPRTLRVSRGLVLVLVPGGADSTPLQLFTGNATVTIDRPGRYAISASNERGGPQIETIVTVHEGLARVGAEFDQLPVAGGQQAAVRGNGSPLFTSINDTVGAGFEEWSAELVADSTTSPPASASYLPPDLQSFSGTLQRNGTWAYEASLGYVWYPRVAADWRPFSAGVWVRAGYYGLVWAGADVWTWPTHHYGGWGLDTRGRWYWQPARRWSAARVSWATGPGYVAWCPLDIHGRPLLPPPFGTRNVAAGRYGMDPWRAWTTVPSHAFGTRALVSRAAIDGRSLRQADRDAFVVSTRPPVRARVSVGTTRSAQGTAVRRGNQTPDWSRQFVPSLESRRDVQRLPTREAAKRPRYERPTPFVNPRWTSRPDDPSAVGLPRPRTDHNAPVFQLIPEKTGEAPSERRQRAERPPRGDGAGSSRGTTNRSSDNGGGRSRRR